MIRKVSPIAREPQYDLGEQDQRDYQLRPIDESTSPGVHRCAAQTLHDQAVRNDCDPEPFGLLICLLQSTRPALWMVLRVLLIIFGRITLFSHERTAPALFSYDLERGRDHGNQQVDQPQTHDDDAERKEQRRSEIVRIRKVVHQIREGVARHDHED